MTRYAKVDEKRFGFTLIELLIVVAIIGILAAIAVPNFLNAQVRAKVAQAYSEIRSLAMANEQYFLDKGTYPNESEHNPWERRRSEAGLFWLTSPISYMSRIPEDPFKRMDDDTERRGYEMGVFHSWERKKNIAYNLFTVGPDGSENGLYSANPFVGPQRSSGQGNTYASSNGLRSAGDIYWYGGDSGVVKNLVVDGQFYNGSFPPNFTN